LPSRVSYEYVLSTLTCTGARLPFAITPPAIFVLLRAAEYQSKPPHPKLQTPTPSFLDSETQNLGKGVLYTCALRPGILYGSWTGRDE